MYIILISIFLTALYVFAWVYQQWKLRRIWKMIGHLPGPPIIIPFLGNAMELLGSSKDLMMTILKLPERYSPPLRMLVGNRVYIGIGSPSDIQVLCNSSKALSKTIEYDYAKPLLRNGMLTSTGPLWKNHRKLISPTFNQKVLNSFVEVFVKHCEVLIQQLNKEVGAGSFDAFRYLSRFAIDSVCETTMGVEINAQIEESAFLYWVNRACEIAYKRAFKVWLRIDMIFKLTPYAKQEKEFIEKCHHFIDKIIKQKKNEYIKDERKNENDVVELDEAPKWRSSLDLMIELSTNGSGFTDEELRDEVTTIVMAGSDTTAVALGFILVVIAMHPDHQENVFEEVNNILGPDGTLEPQDLKRLLYTERVIKETLRIFPPGPIMGRTVDDDLPLESCTLPEGTTCIASIIAVHRDPAIYPDPLKFDPDRFLPEEVAKRHPYSWVPFSAGPRNCIGMNYAMMQLKTTLAYLIRKYKFSTEYKSIEAVELRVDVLIKPVRGHLISIELRE